MAVRNRLSGRVLRLPRGYRLGEPALILLLFLVDLMTSWDRTRPSGPLPSWGVPVYAAAGCALLLLRRRRPLTVLSLLVLHNLFAALLVPSYLPLVAVWVALFTVAARCSRPRALVGLALAVPPTVTNIVEATARSTPERRLSAAVAAGTVFLLFSSVAFAVGRWAQWSVRQRRTVARLAAAEAARAERAMLAGEMHDILSHTLTMMGLQSAGARAVLRTDPAAAEAALTRVDDLFRQAHAELQQLLSVVDRSARPHAPEPNRWSDVPDLLARVRSSGLSVVHRETGAVRGLDPLTDLAGFRVIQESLTNALRHADQSAPVDVAVDWSDAQLNIAVASKVPARQRRVTPGGRGLAGMAERVEAAGGRLELDRGPELFRVRVVLPLGRPRPMVVDLTEPAPAGGQ